MGRFASTVPYYARYREPYPASFFQELAARLNLTGRERLVDVACGPAPLAIGLAPYVGTCVGIDPEPRMIAAARAAAARGGVQLDLIQARLEEVEESLGAVDLVTIGRALHWLDRGPALAVLDRWIAPSGWIVTCASLTSGASINRWKDRYHEILRPWSSDPHERRYRLRPEAFFAGSRFRLAAEIAVTERHSVTIPHLIGRAFSRSTTSPAVLAHRRSAVMRALREGLESFARGGVLWEEVMASATIFR